MKTLDAIQKEERDTLYRDFYLQRLRRDNAIIINEELNDRLRWNSNWRNRRGWR